ncbi:MAG: hypothetical protein AB1721_00260 [Patescibacteria group bacterium]
MIKKLIILFLAGLFILPLISYSVTVGPVKLEYSVDPGDVVKGELFVQNEEKEPRTFYPVFEKFIEEDGTKVFLEGEPTDLASWFKVQDSISLNPNEQKKISFEIVVPKNASPGGHFAVIWWGTAPASAGADQQVAIVTRAGILVYLRVSGEIKEEASLLSFKAIKRFFSHSPMALEYVLENSGNVHLKPGGELKIKNIFGKVKETLPINLKELTVLPQSKKTFQLEWAPEKTVFGAYKAELNLKYGEGQQELNKAYWFFVLPIKGIVIFLGAIIILALAPLGIKKYNSWIISKAEKSSGK